MVALTAPKPWWCGPLWSGSRRFCGSCWRRSWSALWPERVVARPAVYTRSARPVCTPDRHQAPAAPPDTAATGTEVRETLWHWADWVLFNISIGLKIGDINIWQKWGQLLQFTHLSWKLHLTETSFKPRIFPVNIKYFCQINVFEKGQVLMLLTPCFLQLTLECLSTCCGLFVWERTVRDLWWRPINLDSSPLANHF